MTGNFKQLIRVFCPIILALVSLVLLPGSQTQAEGPTGPSTAFTYQGQLVLHGAPVTDSCDFIFGLWQPPISAGQMIGQQATTTNVVNGVFSVVLDFGVSAFTGANRILSISVRCPSGSGDYSELGHVDITGVPYAAFAHQAPWTGLQGVPADFADNQDNDTLATLNCQNGEIIEWATDRWACGTDNISTDGSAGDITAIIPGEGLTGGGTQGDITLATRFAGNGTASSAARSDHHHDNQYYSQANLSTAGTAQVHWANVTNIPADLADGDQDTFATFTCNDGEILKRQGASWLCALDDDSGSLGWTLAGNANLDSTTNFIGTTDNQALVFRVNNTTALRLIPGPFAGQPPNIVAGASSNSVAADAYGAVIDGGEQNVVNGYASTIGGGRFNTINGNSSIIAGGVSNVITGTTSTINGGHSNRIGRGLNLTENANYATIAGGSRNLAGGIYAAVGGGIRNSATGAKATIAGGEYNVASGEYATALGGLFSTASGANATVAGGGSNRAAGDYATVSGGHLNSATGYGATIPGGVNNQVNGDYSFAAGYRAQANYKGSFVWADSTDAYLNASGPDQFIVRASGGVGIGVNDPSGVLHLNGPEREPPSGLFSGYNGLVLGTTGQSSYKWMQSYGGALALNPQGNNVGIGTNNPQSRLEVAGSIRVTGGNFIDDGTTLSVPDYVFEDDYPLLSLDDLQAFIEQEKHLPNVPSEKMIAQDGLNVSQFQMRLLEKIEEQTLYTLSQHQQIRQLQAEKILLTTRLDALESQLRHLWVVLGLWLIGAGSWKVYRSNRQQPFRKLPYLPIRGKLVQQIGRWLVRLLLFGMVALWPVAGIQAQTADGFVLRQWGFVAGNGQLHPGDAPSGYQATVLLGQPLSPVAITPTDYTLVSGLVQPEMAPEPTRPNTKQYLPIVTR